MRILFCCACAVYFMMPSRKWMAALEHVAVPLWCLVPHFWGTLGECIAWECSSKLKAVWTLSPNTFTQLCWMNYLDRGKLEPSYQFYGFEYYLLCCWVMRVRAGQSLNIYSFILTILWATVLIFKPICAVLFIRNIRSSWFMLVQTSCKQL